MKETKLSELELNGENTFQIKPNSYLSDSDRSKVAKGLSKILAESYLLMLKNQNCHWNVRGRSFLSLHHFTEEEYRDLFETVDELAERIRALGFLSPGSLKKFQELSSLKTDNAEESDEEMVAGLLEANEHISKTAFEVMKTAEKANDQVTVDMMVSRMSHHDKASWMLRSFLEH